MSQFVMGPILYHYKKFKGGSAPHSGFKCHFVSLLPPAA